MRRFKNDELNYVTLELIGSLSLNVSSWWRRTSTLKMSEPVTYKKY